MDGRLVCFFGPLLISLILVNGIRYDSRPTKAVSSRDMVHADFGRGRRAVDRDLPDFSWPGPDRAHRLGSAAGFSAGQGSAMRILGINCHLVAAFGTSRGRVAANPKVFRF